MIAKLFGYLSDRSQKNEDVVREHVCSLFAVLLWDAQKESYMRLFGSML